MHALIKDLYLGNRKRVACSSGVITLAGGECWEKTREARKTRGVAECLFHASRVFFKHSPLASHSINTRDVFFYFFCNKQEYIRV